MKEHTEALRAFHQNGARSRTGPFRRNMLGYNAFNKNSSAAKRLNCSL